MIEGKISMSQLIITKSLSMYKRDWIKKDIKELEEKLLNMVSKSKLSESLELQLKKKQDELENAPPYPAHKMLAERMAERDSGNAPSSGERMGYVYISAAAGQLAPKLQGDRIETPAWIKDKGLEIDYKYYMEHQLMNPLSQLFALILEELPGCGPVAKDANRESIAIDYLFGDALKACDKKAGNRLMTKLFGNIVQKDPVPVDSVARNTRSKKLPLVKPKVQTKLFAQQLIINSMGEPAKKAAR
jgi:hypothetical protein